MFGFEFGSGRRTFGFPSEGDIHHQYGSIAWDDLEHAGMHDSVDPVSVSSSPITYEMFEEVTLIGESEKALHLELQGKPSSWFPKSYATYYHDTQEARVATWLYQKKISEWAAMAEEATTMEAKAQQRYEDPPFPEPSEDAMYDTEKRINTEPEDFRSRLPEMRRELEDPPIKKRSIPTYDAPLDEFDNEIDTYTLNLGSGYSLRFRNDTGRYFNWAKLESEVSVFTASRFLWDQVSNLEAMKTLYTKLGYESLYQGKIELGLTLLSLVRSSLLVEFLEMCPEDTPCLISIQ